MSSAKTWAGIDGSTSGMRARAAAKYSARHAASSMSRARPYSLNSPSAPEASAGALCSRQRGSRSRSSAFIERHIMPSSSSPRTMNGASSGEMRGVPSRRMLPSSTTPRPSKSVRPRPASSGAPASKSAQLATAALPCPPPPPRATLP
ncbi:MAG: hypothetical protein EXR63_00215 [Dehalococcoidia bacterium]|nr:hypothetical protein [Dehalococcoidia bacterium]